MAGLLKEVYRGHVPFVFLKQVVSSPLCLDNKQRRVTGVIAILGISDVILATAGQRWAFSAT